MAAVTGMRAVLRANAVERDATWLMRMAGRTLLVAAFLVAGFVAYQLVVTDIIAERGQAGLAEQLEMRSVAVAPVAVPYRPDGGLPKKRSMKSSPNMR